MLTKHSNECESMRSCSETLDGWQEQSGSCGPVGCKEACLHCESSQQSPNPGAMGGREQDRERVYWSIEYNERGSGEMDEVLEFGN